MADPLSIRCASQPQFGLIKAFATVHASVGRSASPGTPGLIRKISRSRGHCL